jgi:hypothetical protein
MSARARRGGTVAIATIAGAFLAGIVVTYFLDTRSGRRRRALLRDKAVHARHVARDGIVKREHAIGSRGRALLRWLGAALRAHPADDDVLCERVRARLGRICSHPHVLEVKPRGGGRIELFGAVLTREHRAVVRAARHVPGVRGVVDALVDRRTDDEVTAFRGTSRPAAFASVSVG